MQSLLPDHNRHNRDRHTFYLMLATFFLIYFVFLAPRPPAPNIDAHIGGDAVGNAGTITGDVGETANDRQQTAADGEIAERELAETLEKTKWITLGSMDPDSDYRMLITFTNRGAAPSRVELNTTRYRDVQELSGYLGQIVADQRLATAPDGGVIVQVVGHGTPAQRFGLQAGDVIVHIDMFNRIAGRQESINVQTFADLRNALLNTRPGDDVDLTIVRAGNRIPGQRIRLGQYPKDVIRPESVPNSIEQYRLMGGLRGIEEQSDPISFLLTLQHISGPDINLQELGLPASHHISNANLRGMLPADPTLGLELPHVSLRDENWTIDSHTANEVVFRRTIPYYGLEVLKTYRLQSRRLQEGSEPNTLLSDAGAGYNLTLNITLRNRGSQARTVAYQIDGPTGLPVEGGWYAMKMGPQFGWYGIRDLVVRLHGGHSAVVSNNVIHVDKVDKYLWPDISPEYIGVDSLYFQCTLQTGQSAAADPWHSRIFPIRVGTKNTEWRQLTNVSFRMWSKPHELEHGEEISHTYTVFAGPKDVNILADHGLGDTISYGWFWFAAIPLLWILHFFHGLGMPYAMAIVALTVCVRLLLFPLSRKQAIGAMKMAEIQPELKALAEKYKDDIQARSKAQSELFKRHNYHPLSGCLPVFIQLPIFIGLYKALTVDAGLYGAPMISSSIRWCTDLSAPDMLFDWSAFWNWLGWTGFNTGQSGLGPYFNLLPILTVILFLIQMMITMPPPTDDQSRLQRKVFQYMMIFMGLLFFKFPSGLCLYFIVSTTWGLAERRFIPKPPKTPAGDSLTASASVPSPERIASRGQKPPGKRGQKSREHQSPAKPEGRFAKWWREVLEKAAEQQKLGQQSKKDKDKDKKKRKR